MYFVNLQDIIDEYELEILTKNIDISKMKIAHPEINRPALQLAGFYDYFSKDRLQLIGKVEHSYLCKMTESERLNTLDKLFAQNIPAIVICRGLEPLKEMLDAAEKYNVPVLRYAQSTTEFMGEIIRWLNVKLAPRVTLHGVLIDVFGEGVLIMGESGIGKSETALELIQRGHRLVADDAVEIKRVSHHSLIGSCPKVIRYFIELRGIGIIDVKQMFGVESVKETQIIDLIVKMEIWDKNKEYDRLGLKEEYMDILGNNIICHHIPIRPGRNLAIICESAAINHRQKKMGYNSAEVLNERILKNMSKNEQ